MAQTSGKISGTVVDKDTGEPLPGVNVMAEGAGTTLGAATDEEGFFMILNAPVGNYEVTASFIGYRDVIMQSVRVSLDLTTKLTFEMEQTTLAGEEVVVVATRPLVQRDATNTNIIRSAQEIENLPTRGLEELASQVAGVVKEENSNVMNIRGGRGSETAMYIDGVFVNDPYNYAVRVDIPNQAIEEMSVQTGGFNAEYGEAMSGIVAITTNPGTKKYHASFEAITDEFLSADNKMLGTYSYGYNEYIGTVSGPIIPGTQHTFFLSGTRKYLADRTPSWGWAENPHRIDDFTFYETETRTDTSGATYLDTTASQTHDFTARQPGNYSSDWSVNGKLRLRLTDNIELKGSLVRTDRKFRSGLYAGAINPLYIFNIEHNPVMLTSATSMNINLTHTLSNNTFYELKVNRFDTQRKWYDAVFKDDLMKYGDPTYNPYPDTDKWYGETYSSRIAPMDFYEPGAQYTSYFKNRTEYWGVDFDISHQLGNHHSLKAGFDYKYHTMREMRIYNPQALASRESGLTDIERYRSADIRMYGYDVNGDETDDGPHFIKKPKTWSSWFLSPRISPRLRSRRTGISALLKGWISF